MQPNIKQFKIHAIDLLDVNPDVINIAGHSLGGSVALALQENFKHNNHNVNAYGAPVASVSPILGTRYRNRYDPVSMLDYGAQTSYPSNLYTQGYDNVDQNKVSAKSFTSYVYKTKS